MPKVTRLFKIAKELNVGTTMLVDHLLEKGHKVENSPNTKIPGELYDLLLKEFASDKLMKEKAEQIAERRNEERSILLKQQTPEPPKKASEEDLEGEILSAAQLRESAAVKKPAAVPPIENTPPPEIQEKEKAPVQEIPKTPVVETPKKEVEQAPEPETEEEEKPASSLKVVGKIDLDALSSSRSKSQPKAKTEKPAEKKEETKKPAEEKPVLKKPEQEAPVEEKAAEKPIVPVAKEPQPIEKKEVPEEVVAKQVEPEAPKEEVKPTPIEAKAVEAPKQPVKEEGPRVFTAEGNAPQLSGLKVLGRIELEPDRKRRRKEETPASTTPAGQKAEEDKGPSKRRRKRKRKKIADDSSTAAKKPVDRKGKPGKEKPSPKEVEESIKSTLGQMGRGASRDRQRLRRAKRDAGAERRRRFEEQMEEHSHVLELTEFITANEFANLISVPVNEIIKSCFELGMMISINQRLDADVLSLLGEEFGYEVSFVDVKETEFEDDLEEDKEEDLETRSPIITVMGHVDHGKTTLLDHLRKASVAEGEAGGITQHIGAYRATLQDGRAVTFLDTPGHEAFTAMRARGAQVTDVVIIVIAADDAVMPQTREAINHAQAAEVPIVFAFNKMDKAGADAERIKGQLAEMNLLVEDWGGEYQSQEISAKNGSHVDDLLEKVLIQSDLLELKANPNRRANGTIIEARLDKGRGNVATLLVQNGTLKVGDPMVAGIHFGKVRALIDQNGERVEEVGPSMPVQVLGLNGQPGAGDRFQVFSEESKAKDVAQKRQELYREQSFRQNTRITLDEIARRRAIGSFNELKLIIKGDVDGSVEALSGSLMKLSTEEVQVNIIMKAVGGITDNDVNLASASDAVIIGFNTRPSAQARSLAEREGIDIRSYSVIYDAINDVKDALEGLLSPEIKEEITGTVEVREAFKVTKVGTVAGCMVTSGKVFRNDPVRVIRDGVVVYTSTIGSLKRFKDDVKEVATGFECGIMVENYNDIKVGDILETFKKTEIKRKLS